MTELLKAKLIGLLSDASPVTNEEMQSAYEDFVTQAGTLSQSEPDNEKSARRLNFTRIELDSLGSAPLYGQGKKCASKTVSSKSNCFHQLRAGTTMP